MAQNDDKSQRNEKKPNNFNVRFKPGTAEWLRSQIDPSEDAETVPAVIRNIIHDARKRKSKKRKP